MNLGVNDWSEGGRDKIEIRTKSSSAEGLRSFWLAKPEAKVIGRHVVGGAQHKQAWLLVFIALWVAFLAMKAVYAAAVAVVPLLVSYLIETIEQTYGATFLGFRVGREGMIPMVALATLTTAVAAYLTITSIFHINATRGQPGQYLICRRLLVAWILLDSVSFYGIVSKVLSYPDTWCYGFVAASAAFTALAGWPLVVARRGQATWRL